MNSKQIIQHITSGLTFFIGLIFCLLKMFGVTLKVDDGDINTLIFALGSLIAIGIELIPFVIKTIKDKNLLKIMAIVNEVVSAIDELEPGLSSYDKRVKAISVIFTECKKQGLKIETADIGNLIETAVALRNKILK